MAAYAMTVSGNTTDKLGVKLYDKVSDVIAELISNAYDADAENVTVRVPTGKVLASRKGGVIRDLGHVITVEDDGHGMDPDEADKFYLKVGTDRRTDGRRGGGGARSPKKNRAVMGRKGIGKLAPFGICKKIEVRSAGGPKGENGYRISHFAMCYDDMVKDIDANYEPIPCSEDRRWSPTPGTRIIMSDFLTGRIPDSDTLASQITRKFSLGLPDFQIAVHDTESGQEISIADMKIDIAEGTKIALDEELDAGGQKLRVAGWVAYSKHPYKNEEVAGIRIYARGKLAAVTRDFGRKAGFAGEHSMRSYLVGEMRADWLDGEEDLIASDRQDILWSSDKGEAFKEWGQKVVGRLGRDAEKAVRNATYRTFADKSNFEQKAKERFKDKEVYEAATAVGRAVGRIADRGMLDNAECVDGLLELILAVAPSKMLVDKLALIADDESPHALRIMSSLFGDAKTAETAWMGQIADARVRALNKLENAIRGDPDPAGIELQKILEEAPWLINPQWTVLQSNQNLENFRKAFQAWYKKTRHVDITTTAIGRANKRPDFVLMSAFRVIEVAEIKKPGHVLVDEEFERLHGYVRAIDEFISANPEIAKVDDRCHVTLVCDSKNVKGLAESAYDHLVDGKQLTQITWEELLSGARNAHEDFLSCDKQENRADRA